MTDDARNLVDQYRYAPLGAKAGMLVLRLAALLVAKGVLTKAEFEWVLWGDHPDVEKDVNEKNWRNESLAQGAIQQIIGEQQNRAAGFSRWWPF